MSAQNHSGVKVNTPTAVFFAAALDIVMVALFAVIGRQSHAIGLSIGAVFQTMWPCLRSGLLLPGWFFGCGASL